MKKKRIIFTMVWILLAAAVNFFLITYRTEPSDKSLYLYFVMDSDVNVDIRVEYGNDGTYDTAYVSTTSYVAGGDSEISVSIPLGYDNYRITYSNKAARVTIEKAYLIYDYQRAYIDESLIYDNSVISGEVLADAAATVHGRFQTVVGIVLCIFTDILCLLIIRNFWRVLDIVREVLHSKKLMIRLALNDFKSRFAGSYLGIIWAFVHPIVTIVVYWFVFQVGFRSSPVDNFPFVLWLSTGLIPWFFFSEALNGATSSLIEYSYLVKKVVFKIGILPIVKILSALFVHLFFVGFIMIFYVCYGYRPHIAWIQVLYYSFCMCALVVGIGYFTSAVMVFFRDLSQVIAIVLQVGNWVTPIMWSYTMLSPKIQWIMFLNPMFYVVQGYRAALIDHRWFFEMPYQTLGFWLFVIAMLGFGMIIFNKLKVHFADVL